MIPVNTNSAVMLLFTFGSYDLVYTSYNLLFIVYKQVIVARYEYLYTHPYR